MNFYTALGPHFPMPRRPDGIGLHVSRTPRPEPPNTRSNSGVPWWVSMGNLFGRSRKIHQKWKLLDLWYLKCGFHRFTKQPTTVDMSGLRKRPPSPNPSHKMGDSTGMEPRKKEFQEISRIWMGCNRQLISLSISLHLGVWGYYWEQSMYSCGDSASIGMNSQDE